MRTEPLLAPAWSRHEPRWRAGVVRSAGQSARLAAAEVVAQLRAAGWMATEIDVTRTDPFIDHRTEWTGRAHPEAYQLITVVGEPSPAVVALAILVGAPLVCLPVGIVESLPTAIEEALASGPVDVVPVALVTVDGQQRFCAGPVGVTPDIETEARWLEGSARRRASTTGCQISPTDEPDGSLELLLTDAVPIVCRQVELHGGGSGLRVDFDGRSRRVSRVVVECLTQRLRVVRLASRP